MALEWLKGILGDKYTEDIDKQVSAEIGKAFVSKADFNTKNTELKNAKDALSDANKTIEGFKSMDVDAIKKSADEWKQKAEKAEKEAAEQIAQLRFDARLDNAILSRHGRSTKGIKAMLDVEAPPKKPEPGQRHRRCAGGPAERKRLHVRDFRHRQPEHRQRYTGRHPSEQRHTACRRRNARLQCYERRGILCRCAQK